MMVGVTHRGSPLPLLELVSIRRGQRGPLLAALRTGGYAEAVVLSTCSRTEIYAVPEKADPGGLLELLAEHTQAVAEELRPCAETRSGLDAVEHLFRVTGGLDSRVIGEVEIHGQVRMAFREAHTAGMTGPILGRLFPAALLAGRRVREETTLGVQARSLASRAVDIGLASLDGLADPIIVVVGSGRMATAAVEHLGRLDQRPQVAARNEALAARLAGSGQVCPMPALVSGVGKADLVICATSAAQHVVTFAQVSEAMAARQSRPLTVVDLSVPRNVDAAVASVAGVRLIDLEGMNDDWTADPQLAAALDAGTAIVEAAVQRYADGVAAGRAGPFIAALRRHVEEACLRELSKMTDSQSLGQRDLARAAHAVAGKILHRPTITARMAAASGDTATLLALGAFFGVQAPAALTGAR
jgi:glutamyl-tRNA reductase